LTYTVKNIIGITRNLETEKPLRGTWEEDMPEDPVDHFENLESRHVQPQALHEA
jgi:hypothetical protein